MVILEILKWIGIILLCLLLTLLCVLLLVLFLPIKYYGEGTYNNQQKYALLKARWFWGLVRVKAAFPQKPYFSVKILWIELLKKQQKESNAEASIPKEEKEQVKEKTVAEPVKEAEFAKEVSLEEVSSQSEELKNDTSHRDEESKEPVWDKVIGIKDKIQYYIGILNEQDTKDLLVHCKIRIIKILKSIRPRKIIFRGIVGFASPDTTGYLYGGYCMVSSYLGKNVILTPDFENEIIDVTGSLKGHITVFVLVWNALRVYFDKRLMRLIAKFKKGGR